MSSDRTPNPPIHLMAHRVNLCVSEHEPDLARLGFGVADVSGFTVRLAQAVLANEGTVAFGHDWREGGIMEEISRFAEEHQDVGRREDQQRGRIESYLIWGVEPALDERERATLRGVLDFVFCGKPPDEAFRDYNSLEQIPPEMRAYAMARSLTTMREQMTSRVQARVCLGGRDMDPRFPERGPAGRCPGVAEEAYLSCRHDQPLYLSGLLGGVTGQIVNAFLKRPAELAFNLPENVARCYGADGGEQRVHDRDYEGPIDSGNLMKFFREYGIGRLSEHNRLTPAENRRLFGAATIEEVQDLVLTGLSRLVSLS